MIDLTKQSGDPRVVYHPHNPRRTDETVRIFVPVDDDTYSDRFDYELLDATPTRDGLFRKYVINCIPFVTYGINKGDIVSIDSKNILKKKQKDGGEYGYRIAHFTASTEKETHAHITSILRSLQQDGYDVEEFNHKISAVSAKDSTQAVKLEEVLSKLIADKEIEAFDTIR